MIFLPILEDLPTLWTLLNGNSSIFLEIQKKQYYTSSFAKEMRTEVAKYSTEFRSKVRHRFYMRSYVTLSNVFEKKCPTRLFIISNYCKNFGDSSTRMCARAMHVVHCFSAQCAWCSLSLALCPFSREVLSFRIRLSKRWQWWQVMKSVSWCQEQCHVSELIISPGNYLNYKFTASSVHTDLTTLRQVVLVILLSCCWLVKTNTCHEHDAKFWLRKKYHSFINHSNN